MKLRTIALTVIAVLLCTSGVYAHIGHRGAHHSYYSYNTTPQYYCGGHSAHYHNNGVCRPYYYSHYDQGTTNGSCIFYEQCHPDNCLNPYCPKC